MENHLEEVMSENVTVSRPPHPRIKEILHLAEEEVVRENKRVIFLKELIRKNLKVSIIYLVVVVEEEEREVVRVKSNHHHIVVVTLVVEKRENIGKTLERGIDRDRRFIHKDLVKKEKIPSLHGKPCRVNRVSRSAAAAATTTT